MTDPWTEFTSEVEQSKCAGYFETVDPENPGQASVTRFSEADAILRVRPEDTVEDLDKSVAEFVGPEGTRRLVGYFGFDSVGVFEPLLRRFPGGSPFPLGEFAVVSATRRETVRIARPQLQRASLSTPPEPTFETLNQMEFERGVERLRASIRDGDAFQVVLSRRRTFRRPHDLVQRAGLLRRSERYRHFFFVKFGDRAVLGASPESVVEFDRGRATLFPIAGTRPIGRGAQPRLPLRRDPKELAEHRMLVDLARNDLGRVARPGTVKVEWTERLERYAQVEHLVSKVSARTRDGLGPIAVLSACFPAGTVCGAPKIRATTLLRREEQSWRGPYGGAIGYTEGSGRSQWALTIRSAFAAGPYLYTAAGAGVVWPSQPDREFAETGWKLAQLESILVEGDRPR